jgi:hypothetical protein
VVVGGLRTQTVREIDRKFYAFGSNINDVEWLMVPLSESAQVSFICNFFDSCVPSPCADEVNSLYTLFHYIEKV